MANINSLIRMLERGQDSALLRFGLACAYLKEKPQDYQAILIQHLEQCLHLDPNYTAAYTMLARAQIDQEAVSDAKRTLTAGIARASAQKDLQAEKTMAVFLKRISRVSRLYLAPLQVSQGINTSGRKCIS